MENLAQLQKEQSNVGARYKALYTQIRVLRNEAGATLVQKGSDSKEFKELSKRIKETEESLEDCVRLLPVYENAIKQMKKEQRRKEMAELLKKNLALVDKVKANLPKCPKCGTNEFVELKAIDPSQWNEPSDTRKIRRITFLCIHFRPKDPALPPYAPGLQFDLLPSELEESLTEKIGEAVKKAGSAVASVLF